MLMETSFVEPSRTTADEIRYRLLMGEQFISSGGSTIDKLNNFACYVPTQEQRKFLVRYELFKKILDVHGSIIECGVQFGGGLMTFANLSEIFEPINHTRRIIGFDTFAGFPSVSEKDSLDKATHSRVGGLCCDSYNDLKRTIELFDSNRFLKHINKVELVKGDVKDTLPEYLKQNPQLVVSLLWLDFDIYEPTKFAIHSLIDRIPKGGIIAFDELNHGLWNGETIAVKEELGIDNLRIKRFPFGGTLSYAVIGE